MTSQIELRILGTGESNRQDGKCIPTPIWEFPKIRGVLLGFPIIRIIVFWGLCWGPPILGNSHMIHVHST